ncbi:MAG: electron transport complex subunit RsxC [Candidatus Marinimicrobia bacterium]|nr:electron transport complex subunit RsxC [Candidatus Neomarinimicrobiota bacterium]
MRLPTFSRGVHPNDNKHYTCSKSIEILPIPDQVLIPLQQHIGAPCSVIVEKGQEVKTGQQVGSSEAFVSSPVHSSITGKVKEIGTFQHPAGGKVQMVLIQQTEEEDDWKLMPPLEDWQNTGNEILNQRIKDAGIVGLGGAAFPTHVKLAPPKDKKIDTFILNGCECEPYLTADHRAMVEQADKILPGMAIIMKILGVIDGFIGIENNKPDAIEVMREAVSRGGYNFKVVSLQVKYPQGAEKMLIQSVLKRQVPTGGLPMDVGAVVNNVGTAIAVADAVINGKSLIERIVTVTGDGINEPKNVLARIGTPFQEILEFCGGLNEETTQVFMGGPMMGLAQHNLQSPTVKATSGIVCTAAQGQPAEQALPCIRCGTCVSVCPMFLLPTRIARLSEMGQTAAAEELGIMNCIECGSCSFVCPSQIPLVQWIRLGKLRVGEMKRKEKEVA